MSRRTKRKRKMQQRPVEPTAAEPLVHHYTAIVRSPFGEWWHDHAKAIRLISLISGGVLVFGWLLVELIYLIFTGHAL